MPFIALFIGVPVTVGLLFIVIYIYNYGLRALKKRKTVSSKGSVILFMIAITMPITILGALYFGGVFKFLLYSFLGSEDILLKNSSTPDLLKKNLERIALAIGMPFVAGTLNIISPIKVSSEITTLYETIGAFIAMMTANIANSYRIYRKYFISKIKPS